MLYLSALCNDCRFFFLKFKYHLHFEICILFQRQMAIKHTRFVWLILQLLNQIQRFLVFLMFRSSWSQSLLSAFMAYHWVCNKSITTGATCGAGTAYRSSATEFTPFFNCLSGVRVVHVFTCLVTYCDVRYDFRLKTIFDSSLLPWSQTLYSR